MPLSRLQPRLAFAASALLGLFLAILLVGLWSGSASAQAPATGAVAAPSLDIAEEADLHFKLGVDAYKAGDFEEALVHLLYSNRLAPNKNVIFNIARAYENLEDFPQAFRHYSDFITLEADGARRKAAEDALARIQPKVALLRVETRPAGATLYVDRKDLGARGVSPRSLALEPGTHKILLEMEGFEPAESKPVNVQLGTESVVILDMRQILGTVILDGTPRGATVRVDNEDGPAVGLVPGALDLPPGNHVLIVSHPGYQTVRQMVNVLPKQTVQAAINLNLVTGTLVVNAAERGALIEIDGQAAGFTPAVLPAVPAGEHNLKVTLPGYRPFELAVDVKADEQTVVTARLRSLQEITAASRAAQALEDAPASVTLISQEEIRAFGYETLYDALGGTRGVYQTNDQIYQYLGFRGFSRLGDYGNRVLVTLDGHTMNDDQLGSSYVGYDLMSDLQDVERIEVVRGPGSALYGTSAFFGVLNLVTRDKDTMNQPNVGIAADGVRTARVRASASGKNDSGVGAWVSAGAAGGQGRDFTFEELQTEDQSGISEDADGFQSGTVSGKAWMGDLTVQGMWNARRKRIPNAAYFTTLADEDASTTDTRGFLELRYEPSIGDRLQVYSRVYMDVYTFEGVYPYVDPEIGNVRDSWTGAWAGVEPRIVATPTDWFSLTAGLEGRFDYLAVIDSRLKADRCEDGDYDCNYLHEEPTYQTLSGYAVAQVLGGDLIDASLGARLDRFSYAETNTSDPPDQTAVNPRLALIIKPGLKNVFKLVGGRAFRTPSPYELNYNDEGYSQLPAPDDIVPEYIYTGELEYTRRFSDIVSASGSVYYNRITNLIDTIELQNEIDGVVYDVLQYDNVDDVIETVGEELEIRRSWRDGWMLAVNQAFQYTREGGLSDGAVTVNSPAHLLALKAAMPLAGSGAQSLSTRIRYESGRKTITKAFTQPALLWDMTLTGQVPVAGVSWGVGVRNLLDWKVEHPAGYDYEQLTLEQTGRTIWVSTSVSF